jgi:hypothetical protein
LDPRAKDLRNDAFGIAPGPFRTIRHSTFKTHHSL